MKPESLFLSLFLLFAIFQQQIAYSMHWETDMQLRDLEYNAVEFVGEASHWSCTSLQKADNNTYDCNGVYYLGGFNIMATNNGQYFYRTYYTLPIHNQVNVSMTFLAMDGWDGIAQSTDRFDVDIDGTTIQGFIVDSTSTSTSSYVEKICGGAPSEYPPFKATFTFPHTSTTSLTIKVISRLTDAVSDESIAFRDLVLDFVTVSSPAQSKCAVSIEPLLYSSYACDCPLTNQYQNPSNSGTCSFCDETCETCSGGTSTECLSCYPYTNRYQSGTECLSCYTGCVTCTGGSSTECTSCDDGYYLADDGACYTTCDFPLYIQGNTESPLLPNECLTPCHSSYVYWDATCSSTCDSPLVASSTNSYLTCTYPCGENQYLYWNASCLDSCPYPLTTRVLNYRYFCDFPCSESDFYLYWDQSCSSTCASTYIPLVEVTEGTTEPRNYCRFQCTPSQYLYWNGSCLDTCPYPLTTTTINSRLFCSFPCDDTSAFLYWNGSCISTCAGPLTSRTEGVALIRYFCDYTCGISTDYLYWNGTCSICLSPLSARTDVDNNFCDYPCDLSEWLYWDGSCQTSCDSPLVQDYQGTPVRNFCQYYCQLDQYLYWNGSCLDECDSPLSKRYANSRKFCDFPCADDEYLYWNGSCLSSCSSPLDPRVEGTPSRLYCDCPCTSASEYLYWNGTCGSCESPLVRIIIDNDNYCEYPCDTSEWLYWDGTCNSTCPIPPLTQLSEGTPSRNYCEYSCSTTQYLYWNGSCFDTCDSPLVSGTNNERLFCYYPCLTTEYLYPNGTCSTKCSSLFISETVASRKYCTYPCLSSQVLLYDGTCLDSCNSPYALNVYSGMSYCDLPCPSDYYWLMDAKTCNETCNSPYTINTQKPYLRCIPPVIILSSGNLIEAPTKPETVTFLTLVKPMQYMRYLEMNMPERLERLAASQGRNILSTYFGLQIGASANLSFFRETLPYVYARHNVQSSFLVNYWQDLITLLIGIGVALLFYTIEKVSFSEGWELLELISQRLRVILMWNYVLMIFAVNIDDLILFAAIEYMTLNKQPDAPASTPVSFLLSLVFLALMLGFIYGIYRLVQRRRTLLRLIPSFKRSKYAKGFDLKYENYQVLYRGFKDNYLPNQLFFLIYMLRIGVPMIVAVSAIDDAKFVCIFQLCITAVVLLYLFIMRPFKKLINQIQLVSYELVILMMNICLLILAIRSPSGADSSDSVRLGDAVIIGNDIINFSVVVFLVIKLYLEATALYKDIKRLKRISTKEKITTYLQLLALPIQMDNMGFEEMINYYCPPPKPWFEPLVQRLFNIGLGWISSTWKAFTQEFKDLFSTKNNDDDEFDGDHDPSNPAGYLGSEKNIHKHKNKNGNKKSFSPSSWFSHPSDKRKVTSGVELANLDGLHTYDYEHKLYKIEEEQQRKNADETINGEIRLINQENSITELTYDKSKHIDGFASLNNTSQLLESQNHRLRNRKSKKIISSPQGNVALGDKFALNNNAGLSLEPSSDVATNKIESPHGIDSDSAKKSRLTLGIRKKRGKINPSDFQLDVSDLLDQHPAASGIPDILSPIAKVVDSSQTTPIPTAKAHKQQATTLGDIKKRHKIDFDSEDKTIIKKDYEGYEWNKEDTNAQEAFDLELSTENKTLRRKKKGVADFKLSSLDDLEEKNKDYLGWKPY